MRNESTPRRCFKSRSRRDAVKASFFIPHHKNDTIRKLSLLFVSRCFTLLRSKVTESLATKSLKFIWFLISFIRQFYILPSNDPTKMDFYSLIWYFPRLPSLHFITQFTRSEHKKKQEEKKKMMKIYFTILFFEIFRSFFFRSGNEKVFPLFSLRFKFSSTESGKDGKEKNLPGFPVIKNFSCRNFFAFM